MNRRVKANHAKPRLDAKPESGVAVTNDGFSVVLSVANPPYDPAVQRMTVEETDHIIELLHRERMVIAAVEEALEKGASL